MRTNEIVEVDMSKLSEIISSSVEQIGFYELTIGWDAHMVWKLLPSGAWEPVMYIGPPNSTKEDIVRELCNNAFRQVWYHK